MPPKSGVSRTRNVGYDDDDDIYDDDDYYDEGGDDANAGDGMTEDDKEQMRIGTTRVREALGDASDFTSDEQIQEALWHYYYDVGKCVTYLKNKLGAAEPKQEAPKQEKTKQTSRFDQAASVAHQNAPTTAGKQSHVYFSDMQEPAYSIVPLPTICLPPISMPAANSAITDFFWDIPWGNVPPERIGVITVDAPHYKGGLLGGSSKLAALAAKRRKEREDAEAAASKTKSDADAAIAMLDKLSVNNTDNTGNVETERPSRVSRYPIRRRSPSPTPEIPKEPEMVEPEAPQPAIVVDFPAQRATASTFASTLCGSDYVTKHPQAQSQEFPVPFAAYKSFDGTGAFAGPSPDDVVRAAQAKGAGSGRH